ncbi:unnamed protein product [Lupinus luteus]|uniref:RING-type E3 ubiquitin transferase n=1 Tax=Lupinus luteus TaxID=3873 RepID=A0AAV1YE67_LUPLU
MAVKCAELRRKDRPDLGKEILPELNKLREFAEERMCPIFLGGRLSCTNSTASSPNNTQPSIQQDVLSNPHHDVETEEED